MVQDLHLFKKCSSTGWSQSSFAFHMSCIRALAVSATGAANPSGSYNEQTADRIPRFVSERFKFLISNPSSSVSTNQRTPSALSTGNSSSLRSRFGVALLWTGIEDKTSLLLDMNFVRQKPP